MNSLGYICECPKKKSINVLSPLQDNSGILTSQFIFQGNIQTNSTNKIIYFYTFK